MLMILVQMPIASPFHHCLGHFGSNTVTKFFCETYVPLEVPLKHQFFLDENMNLKNHPFPKTNSLNRLKVDFVGVDDSFHFLLGGKAYF